jgi:hypothetical protein
MPQLIPVIGAVFTGTGFFGAGGAIATGLASFGLGPTMGGVIAGALGGALVGAAIGGLTSLVTGGDIGKGLLYGAVGGAVTGGIGGYFDAQSFAALSSSQDAVLNTPVTSPQGWESALGKGAEFAGGNTGQVTMSAADAAKTIGAGGKEAGGLLGTLGEEGTGALITGGIGLVGSTLQGMGEQERWEKQMEIQIAEAEKQRQHEMKKLQTQLNAQSSHSGGAAGSDRDWAAELAENRRQFDQELSNRKKEFAQTMDVRKQELYAPMEYEKERKRRAGGALASVSIQRGQYKQAPSIKSQLQQANKYPDAVQQPLPPKQDEAVA